MVELVGGVGAGSSELSVVVELFELGCPVAVPDEVDCASVVVVVSSSDLLSAVELVAVVSSPEVGSSS